MKALIPILLMFLALFAVKAQMIEIGIQEVLQGNISALLYNQTSHLVHFQVEFFNSGSVDYKARARIDIFKGSRLLYTGWSDEREFWPGARESFDLFWYPSNLSGDFKARIRIYYAGEIAERVINFSIQQLPKPQSIFQMLDFRTYDEWVKLSIRSQKSVEGVVLIPSGFPRGWVFEQAKLKGLEEGKRKTAYIKYEPAIWRPVEVKIYAISQDGKFVSFQTFKLEREKGLLKYVRFFLDYLKDMLNI